MVGPDSQATADDVPNGRTPSLEAEILRLQGEIEAAQKDSRQYLQNVAHQLTAPLNAIKWSIEALKNPEVHLAKKEKLLSSIYSQATILVHLIKNFSLMSNLEADHELGQFREKPEVVDITALAINLAGDFQPQASEGRKKIVVLDGTFEEVLQGRSLLVVKNLIAQAMSNLIENAVKYSDLHTTIELSASQWHPKREERAGLSVTVKSTGIPLAPSEVTLLATRGFRSSAARQKVPAGTGIGLYLANRIMELH